MTWYNHQVSISETGESEKSYIYISIDIFSQKYFHQQSISALFFKVFAEGKKS